MKIRLYLRNSFAFYILSIQHHNPFGFWRNQLSWFSESSIRSTFQSQLNSSQ